MVSAKCTLIEPWASIPYTRAFTQRFLSLESNAVLHPFFSLKYLAKEVSIEVGSTSGAVRYLQQSRIASSPLSSLSDTTSSFVCPTIPGLPRPSILNAHALAARDNCPTSTRSEALPALPLFILLDNFNPSSSIITAHGIMTTFPQRLCSATSLSTRCRCARMKQVSTTRTQVLEAN